MKPIQTGLASYGMSGSVFHAPFLDVHPMFELRTIVERTKNKARERYPYVRIARSYDELLADSDIQLVVVNTPDVTHYEFARRALLAGKHVIVEKPFVSEVSEGEELISLAKEKRLMLAVYQNRRWDGDFLTVQEVIRSGILGRVVEFQSAYQRYRNYIQEGTWKEKKAGSHHRIGLTYNLGSHMIDQAVRLFGLPQAVYADIAKLREGSEVDDYYHIQLIYPSVKVSLRAGYLMREETPRYYVHGTKGSFVKYGLDPQEELLKAGISPALPGWGTEKETDWGILNTETEGGLHFRGKIETLRGNYAAFYDDICDAFRNHRPAATDASGVLPVIRLIEAAFQSVQERRVVSL
ncbi:MAG: Gfo/Idh/MocA family oxidoreductase [Tannerellaceae bacterium]|jgi:predicted dehydrogenase|nr:Gfo/Idh/MocA family oxidoreductase [Tannerellaceae bacterium]